MASDNVLRFSSLVIVIVIVGQVIGQRRNLSEITYRFTNCESTNHDGPRVNTRCFPLYQEMDSPIVANDDSFFQFEDGSYDGAQGFRVPKDDLYNMTIAGAAGGMGVCNYEFGNGGMVNVQVRLTTDYEYLILVGQRGTSVCDTNRTHIFCTNPPTNLTEASLCDENWETWTSSLPANNDTNFHYLRNGGGGGGGASMVWPRRRNNREFTNLPIAIGPGGGGASAILDYDYLANELVSLSSAFEIQYPNESDAMTINRYYINAHLQPFLSSSSWTPGARGIRPDGLNVVTSGSGGGWNPTLLLSLINVDGKLLSQRTDFAEGGFDCTSRIFSSQDRNVFRDVFGGYGGGGGGCGSGGAGGGYTGGHVLSNDNKNSGGGGDVGLFPDQIPNFRYNMSSSFRFNNGDGYVEIVSSDCTCAGWCIVYANEGEFECFCPNGTSLAPDGSSCYEESNVIVNAEDPLVLLSGEESYTINGLQFTNSSVNVLSLDVALSVQPLPDSTLPEEDVACAVVFIGSDSQIILSSNSVRIGGGRANNIASLDTVGDGATEIIYTSLLDSPILVTGAFLFTNGNCSLIGPFQLNISTEDASTTPAQDFNNTLVVGSAVLQILGIGKETRAVKCQALPIPENGRISYTPDSQPDYDLGTVATYTCNSGRYKLEGSVNRSCVALGSGNISMWDGGSESRICTLDSQTIAIGIAVGMVVLCLLIIFILTVLTIVLARKKQKHKQATISELPGEFEHIYENPDQINFRPPLPKRNISVTDNSAYDRAFEMLENNCYGNSNEEAPGEHLSGVQGEDNPKEEDKTPSASVSGLQRPESTNEEDTSGGARPCKSDMQRRSTEYNDIVDDADYVINCLSDTENDPVDDQDTPNDYLTIL